MFTVASDRWWLPSLPSRLPSVTPEDLPLPRRGVRLARSLTLATYQSALELGVRSRVYRGRHEHRPGHRAADGRAVRCPGRSVNRHDPVLRAGRPAAGPAAHRGRTPPVRSGRPGPAAVHPRRAAARATAGRDPRAARRPRHRHMRVRARRSPAAAARRRDRHRDRPAGRAPGRAARHAGRDARPGLPGPAARDLVPSQPHHQEGGDGDVPVLRHQHLRRLMLRRRMRQLLS